jgi:hypothetical protein
MVGCDRNNLSAIWRESGVLENPIPNAEKSPDQIMIMETVYPQIARAGRKE